MLLKFQNHIDNNLPFLKGKKLLLATSGGIDSMVLVDLCHQSKLDFAIAHCNFQLRGEESDEDENFVKTQMEKFQIPNFIQRFDTKAFAEQNKLSIQVVARNLRYEWFYTLLANHNFDYILTAHHLDDSLETFLINFTRGSGLDGLTGIPEQNDKIIRPLLVFSRNEIEAFAKENQITWREDSSNTSDKYLRNKIRHYISPQLKELNPNFLNSFANTQTYLRDTYELSEAAVHSFKMTFSQTISGQIHYNITEFTKLFNYKAYLYEVFKHYEFDDWDGIYNLVHAESGKRIESKEFVLTKNRHFLILHKKKINDLNLEFFIEKNQKQVKIPIKIAISKVTDISEINSQTIFVDESKIQFPLTIRKFNDTDVFFPFGMKGSKKVSKFFKDQKLLNTDKQDSWILSSNNQIVWIINHRMDDRFKITPATKKILKITTS